jgi:NADH dehydrogenase
LLTIVVVGGGPTGVELAGAFAELARHVLRRDFRHIDPGEARVVLLEGGDRVLAHLAPDLSASAQRQLEALGVEVRLRAKVAGISAGLVELADGTRIPAANIIWAAGIAASPLTRSLGVATDRAGRLQVQPDLSLPGHPEVFAIGDLALVLQENGKPVPGVSPAAIQEAQHVAQLIGDELAAPAPGHAPRPAFRYWDKGSMATIGRSAAVAEIGAIRFSGFPAWLAWLFVHLIFLVGFRNKLAVLLQWFYSYCTYRRGARIVTAAGTGGRTA